MDFSALLLIPLAAIVSALWIVGLAAVSGSADRFKAPFVLSYSLAFLLMQPWLIASWQQAGMVAVILVPMAIWIAAGCILGAIPAMIVVAALRVRTH